MEEERASKLRGLVNTGLHELYGLWDEIGALADPPPPPPPTLSPSLSRPAPAPPPPPAPVPATLLSPPAAPSLIKYRRPIKGLECFVI